MTLSDLVTRGVQLELHESVAVVREALDRAARVGATGIPDLHQLVLHPSGTVEPLGIGFGDPAQRSLEIIEALSGAAAVPPQLASMLQAAGGSMLAVSETLAYFERPNRPAVLQEVYRQAGGLDTPADTDALIASLRTTAATAPQHQPSGEESGWSPQQRQTILLGGILLAAVIAAVSVIALLGGNATENPSEDPSIAGQISNAVGSAVSSVGQRVGLSRPEPPPPAPTPQPETPPSPAPPRSSAPRRPASAPASPPKGEPAGTEKPREVIDEPQPVVLVESAAETSSDEGGAVYSAQSAGVNPPVALRPQLPRVLTDQRLQAADRIELVVGTDGSVETVHLLGGAETVHDTMLLSAVKAWKFRPAMKDGAPVRYRTIITAIRERR